MQDTIQSFDPLFFKEYPYSKKKYLNSPFFITAIKNSKVKVVSSEGEARYE